MILFFNVEIVFLNEFNEISPIYSCEPGDSLIVPIFESYNRFCIKIGMMGENFSKPINLPKFDSSFCINFTPLN